MIDEDDMDDIAEALFVSRAALGRLITAQEARWAFERHRLRRTKDYRELIDQVTLVLGILDERGYLRHNCPVQSRAASA